MIKHLIIQYKLNDLINCFFIIFILFYINNNNFLFNYVRHSQYNSGENRLFCTQYGY
jgi:hypothetical protein